MSNIGKFDWNRGFVLDFSLIDGLSNGAESTKRYLSQMKGMYYDTEAQDKILQQEDPLIYEFYELGCPEREEDLAFGTTILYPGKIGNQYYMTKGHFHNILETGEIYYTLRGEGYLVTESPEGDTVEYRMEKEKAVYVPRRYAHRTVNTGNEPMVCFYAMYATAGHEYGTIERKGFRKLIVEKNGVPVVIDNPRWI